MAFIQYEKMFSRKWFISYSLIIIGAFIMAAGFVLFITPHMIVPGGVYGISIVLHHMFGFPVGLTALVFDIPLTLIGIKVLGPRFGIKTVVGFVFTAFFVDSLTYLYGDAPLIPDDVLLSAIYGGILVGVGLGLIFKSKATSGGSDIVAMIISKYTKLPIGQLLILVDSTIVLFGLLSFGDWNVPLYSLITIYVAGRVVDMILQGVSYDKSLFIVSKKPSKIKEKIITDLNRGGTIFNGKGLYNDEDKEVIYTVLNRREVEIIQDYIHQIDPNAFMVVNNANEILGNGFKSLKEKFEDD